MMTIAMTIAMTTIAFLLTLAGNLATAAEVILSSAVTNNPRHRRMSWGEWVREGCGGC